MDSKKWSFKRINDEIEKLCDEGIDEIPELDEAGGLITPIDVDSEHTLLEQALDALEIAREAKVESIGHHCLKLKERKAWLDLEIKRLTIWSKQVEGRRSWLIAYCLGEMVRGGIRKIAGKLLTVSVRKSPVSATYAMNMDDTPNVDAIDSRYIRTFTEFKVDKKSALDAYRQARKEYIDAGGDPDGFHFVVKGIQFHNRNNHLSVK